jgi:hypothetical protein
MWNVTRGPIAKGDPDPADAALGIKPDDIKDFCMRELFNEEEWPYFRIALRSGFSLEVEYANFPEDYEVLYSLCQNDWASSICLGKGGGHWQLPAFRWTELLELSQAAVRSQTAMLLLLPSVWLTREDNVDEIRHHLIDSWDTLAEISPCQVSLLVEQLISASQSDLQWRHEDSLGWVNDGANSRRNPDSPASLSRQEFSALLAFFTAMSP